MRRAFFFIVAIFVAASSFASIPRASMLDRATEDASAFVASLPETRIRVSEVLTPFERPAESELTRALHQAYEQASTTSVSGLRRFLSTDPVLDIRHATKNPQGWNRYSYVENNPMNRTDPNGRCSSVLSCAGWALGGAGTAAGLTLRLIGVASVMYMESRSTHVGDLKPTVVPQILSEGVTWDAKIDKQLGKRGWDTASVHDTVNNPDRVLDAIDRRSGNDEPATAYMNPDGSYVIVNNATGEIVQISDRNDPKWIPDKSIKEKDPPEPKKDDEKPEPPL